MPDSHIYEGLNWIPDPLGKPNLIGTSLITPICYVVQYEDDGRASLLAVFSKSELIDIKAQYEPYAEMGNLRTPEEAIHMAELHDYSFFMTKAMADGVIPLFRGSQRSDPADPNEIGETDGRLPLVPLTADGRPFHLTASFFEAVKTANKQKPNGSFAIEITSSAQELPLWLLEAPMATRLMVGAIPIGMEDDTEAKEIASIQMRARMRPGEPEFQQWMAARYDKWGLIATALNKTSDDVESAVSETVKRLIGVPTRADMRTNKDARDRFEKLDREFYLDMARSMGIYIAKPR